MKKEKNILAPFNDSENPFRIPDGYFQNFQERIELQIKNNPQKISLIQKTKPWIYIAASFMLICFCFQSYISGIKDLNYNTQIQEKQEKEDVILYTYLDDFMIIDYLVSEEE